MVRAKLVREHGQPKGVDAGLALRLLGRRHEVHPRDVVAFVYPSVEAERAYAEANEENWGHGRLGPMPVDGGILGVTDLRPVQKRDWGIEPTDPALPDNWRPDAPPAAS
jgi:hypothetical protein